MIYGGSLINNTITNMNFTNRPLDWKFVSCRLFLQIFRKIENHLIRYWDPLKLTLYEFLLNTVKLDRFH
jgi:hypothetical protein